MSLRKKTNPLISGLAMSFIASSVAYAHDEPIQDFCGHRVAIQGAIATGGIFGIGLVDYTDITEIGFTISGSISDGPFETKTVTPVIFAGIRNLLTEHTYFAWGLDLNKTFGTVDGSNIHSDFQIGLYISLEQMLTNHVMLVGWIDPYHYGHQKFDGVGVSTNQFFRTGGLGLNYLFG